MPTLYAFAMYLGLGSLYGNQPCGDDCSVSDGTPVIVTGTTEVGSLDLVLPHGVLSGDDFVSPQ